MGIKLQNQDYRTNLILKTHCSGRWMDECLRHMRWHACMRKWVAGSSASILVHAQMGPLVPTWRCCRKWGWAHQLFPGLSGQQVTAWYQDSDHKLGTPGVRDIFSLFPSGLKLYRVCNFFKLDWGLDKQVLGNYRRVDYLIKLGNASYLISGKCFRPRGSTNRSFVCNSLKSGPSFQEWGSCSSQLLCNSGKSWSCFKAICQVPCAPKPVWKITSVALLCLPYK